MTLSDVMNRMVKGDLWDTCVAYHIARKNYLEGEATTEQKKELDEKLDDLHLKLSTLFGEISRGALDRWGLKH